MLLSIFTIVFLCCVCFAYKPLLRFNDDFLNIENCVNLRGIMAIGIILCHVLLEVPQTDLGLSKIFLHCGYLFVSVFFLLSGYGLMQQYKGGGICI